MRILAFVDVHGSMNALETISQKAGAADILLCAGDISRFETNLDKLLRQLDSFGKLVFIVPGNHEEPGVLEKQCSRLKNVFFLHKKAEIVDGVLFLGFGSGGFEQSNREMEAFFGEELVKPLKASKVVFLTHAPPYKTQLDRLDRKHVGNNSLKNLILKFRPAVVVCGHFHENWGKQEWVSGCLVVNPGPSGRILEL
ncbi:MAG: metallophosphoesterase [Candidatus Woesearchaeota archaeon]